MLLSVLTITYRALIKPFDVGARLSQWKDVVRYTVGGGLRHRYNLGV
jgi:hypothetical protein